MNEPDVMRCTALLWAAILGRAEVVRLLFARKGVEVNKSGPDGFTALFIASHHGHVEVVRLLLARQGVEDNKTTEKGATALMIASENGHVEVVRLLLVLQGVELNQAIANGVTALDFASLNGHVEVFMFGVRSSTEGCDWLVPGYSPGADVQLPTCGQGDLNPGTAGSALCLARLAGVVTLPLA